MAGSLIHLKRAAAVLLPAAAGAALFGWFLASREALPKTELDETVKTVRVVEAMRLEVQPRARGYGSVRPARSWTAVADVEGRVVHEHPDLEQGAAIAAGASLLRIDPTDYELAIQQTEAQIDGIAAQLAELEARKANLKATIEIQARATELARRDYERAQRLLERGAVAESTRDARQQSFLGQRRQLRDLRNELNLIPAQRRRLEANRAELQARLAREREDLARTAIKAPFVLRLAQVNVEREQYVAKGERLVVGDSVDAAEVPAEMPIRQLRQVLSSAGLERDGDVARLNERLRAANLSATIRLQGAQAEASWQGRLVRIGDGLNAQTRTVPAVVRVAEPYHKGRYPLIKNMYVQVDVHGRAQSRVVVPRAAFRDGRLQVVGDDGRLRLTDVQVAYTLGDAAVLKDGLDAGRRVVMDDLVPAIEGLQLNPVPDRQLEDRIRADVQGGAEPAQ